MGKRTLMAIGAHADEIDLNVRGPLVKYREMGYDWISPLAQPYADASMPKH